MNTLAATLSMTIVPTITAEGFHITDILYISPRKLQVVDAIELVDDAAAEFAHGVSDGDDAENGDAGEKGGGAGFGCLFQDHTMNEPLAGVYSHCTTVIR
jgi:hypothetical protein